MSDGQREVGYTEAVGETVNPSGVARGPALGRTSTATHRVRWQSEGGSLVEMDNHEDENGYPAGGYSRGTGIYIDWQAGPRGPSPEGEGEWDTPDGLAPANGAFVEDLLRIVTERMKFYQETANHRFACRENALAITHMQEAGFWLQERRRDRRERDLGALFDDSYDLARRHAPLGS